MRPQSDYEVVLMQIQLAISLELDGTQRADLNILRALSHRFEFTIGQ